MLQRDSKHPFSDRVAALYSTELATKPIRVGH